MRKNVRFIGVAPGGTFSGFEKSFFHALEMQGWSYNPLVVELGFFKLVCTIAAFSPDRSIWGQRRDSLYHTSIVAFKKKSTFAKARVANLSNGIDFIFQIGSLWNPLPPNFSKPFVLAVDYTPKLSEKRTSEWDRKPGAERAFWAKEVKELFNQASVICAVTKNAKDSVVNDYGIPAKKVRIIGPGISAVFPSGYDAFHDRLPEYDSRRILFVGKGYKGKGLDTLLEAFKKVRLQVPDAVLTVVGPATKVSGDGVEYLGRINDRNKIWELYYRSSIFAMPSIFEPIGQVFLEAMSCHLPCIGTTIDAMPELIEDGVTGYTICPGDANELSEKIIFLLSDPKVAQAMGVSGYEKYQREFTWGVIGQRLSDAVMSAI